MGRGVALTYSEEVKSFIRDHQYGISRKELTSQVNQKFGTDFNTININAYCKRNKLCNGFDGRFVKGQPSHNKGVPMPKEIYEKAKTTMFQKGSVPHNHRPVGSERVNVDGYVEVKVQDPKTWRMKQNLVWESVHGKIPKGCVVIFLDGNKLNTDIRNLKLIARSELLIMNRYGLFQESPELTETAAILSGVIDKCNKAKKRRKEST